MMDASELEGDAFCSNVIIRDSFQVFQAAIASELRRMQTTIDDLHAQLASETLSSQHNVPDEYLQDVVKATVRELTAHIDDDDDTKQRQLDQSLQFVPDCLQDSSADLKENGSQPGDDFVPAKGPSAEEPCESDEPQKMLDGEVCPDESIRTEMHLTQTESYEDSLDMIAPGKPHKPKRQKTSLKHELGEEVIDISNVTRASRSRLTVRDPNFFVLDIFPAIIIFLNAITIGVSLEFLAGHMFWDFLELFFLVCYILEAVVKIYWFGLKFYCCGPDWAWHWFDVFCISISIADQTVVFFISNIELSSGALSLAKIFRMARLARLFRFLRFSFFDELRNMVFGVISGLRSLFWAAVLLLLCIYVFGVASMTILGTEEPGIGSLRSSMFTVFRCFTDGCTAPDGSPLHHALTEKYGVVFMITYILSFMLVTLGVFNLIMAIFMDSVMASSTQRNLEHIGKTYLDMKSQMTHMFYKQMMQNPEDFSEEQFAILTSLGNVSDLDEQAPDLSISRDRFQDWMKEDEVRDVLRTADIETSNLPELFDVLDVDKNGELSVDELIHGLLRMRGPVTKADIIAIRLKVGHLTNMFKMSTQTEFNVSFLARDAVR